MSLTDDMDLYRETLNLENKTALFKKKPAPYQEWQETILVKNKPPVVLSMIETSHGPVMDAVLEEKNLALKWAFHDPKNNPMKALRLMGEAKSMQAFEAALKHGTAPGLNVMYADPENIAWWMFGDVAIKNNPNSDLVLDGASGNDEYLRVMSWEEKPHLVNPPSGYIITANSRPMNMPKTLRGDWQSDDRYQTIDTILKEKDQWNAEDFKELQTKNFNVFTKPLLEKLFEKINLTDEEYKTYETLLSGLKSWDMHSEVHSWEAAFFHQWNNENIVLMLEGFSDEARKTYLNTPYAWSFYRRTLLDDSAAWWNDKDMQTIITRSFKGTVEKLSHRPQWGDIHTVEYVHPLGRNFPLNKIFNLGPYPMPGAYNEINNNKMRAMGGDFKVVAGPSTRRVIDFANPQKSWGINPIGISGHMLSPFYKDQVQLFIDGKYREQWLDRKDIETVKTHEMILR